MTDSSLTISVAGIVLNIRTPEPAWKDVLSGRYCTFLTGAAPDWQIEVREDPSYVSEEPGWARHEGARTGFHVYSYRGEIDLQARTAWVTAPVLERLPSAIERVLTYVLMQALPRTQNSLLLHACGLVLDGRGYAFFGPSGAGKTTVAQLAQGRAQVLSDENVVLRVTGDGVELVSTPLWGSSTPPEMIRRVDRTVPLAGLFSLEHAPDFSLIDLAPGQSVAALLDTEKVATERVESALAWLDIADRIVQRAPVRRLAFRPTPELWAFLLRQESDAAA